MSWRTVCISKRAKLELRMGTLVVRGEETIRISLSEIAVLIVESTAVSLTSSLLSELMRKKVKVIFCDEKHNPSSELIPYYGCHDTSLGIRNQMAWTDDCKKAVWANIVVDKIQMQAQHLLKRHRHEAKLLLNYIEEIEDGDVTNREGHAAKVYFNALFGLEFSRQDDHPINAALNYGYSIILSLVSREIVSSGRITQIGIWHSNVFNYFNLSSDLMEPFRPIVDTFVYELGIGSDDFTVESKHKMLEMIERGVIVNNSFQRLPNAIRLYVQKTMQALDDNDASVMASIGYV